MPNNSCTVVLNGHGSYKGTYVIGLAELSNSRVQNGQPAIDYNIIFYDAIRKPVSNAQHNMLLDYLHTQTIQSLTNIENYPTTYIVNRNINIPQPGVINMEERQTPYIYEHYLSNAPDVINVNTLIDINQYRFVEQNHVLVDYTTPTRVDWNTNNANGSIKIQFDEAQVIRDVQTAYAQPVCPLSGAPINLSADNILYITPVAQQTQSIKLSLSELLTDILPKIKIGVLYTPPAPQHGPVLQGGQPLPSLSHVEVSKTVFLDDSTVQNPQNFLFSQVGINDVYHEVTIAGDANIIWDACRDLED